MVSLNVGVNRLPVNFGVVLTDGVVEFWCCVNTWCHRMLVLCLTRGVMKCYCVNRWCH